MTPQLIAEIVSLIVQLGPLGVDLFVKLEGLMNLGPDAKQNIANAIAASDAADSDTISRTSAWMSASGFKTHFVLAAPAPSVVVQAPPA